MPIATAVLLGSQNRTGRNVSVSAVVVPARVKQVRAFLNLREIDKLADGLACFLDIERSSDGVSWMHLAGFGWTSYGHDGYPAGHDGIPNPDPSILFDPSPYEGERFRIVVTAPSAIQVGATLEVTT